ncbi:nuclear transport factor 2 family protein [Salegentibacter chungangensis]|uniref:Nuclear transport factor 2 family protein n=1 Tax=Salegentibacter chungangensis TaxID=1335724 RepID=A0ABW3NRC2_9FLAO
MKRLFIILTSVVFLFSSCNDSSKSKDTEQEPSAEPVNSKYEIASEAYSELNEQALMHMANLDFDAWGEMLDDNVEYFFPDGDADTRTVLKGKNKVLRWWQDWKANSGIEKMSFENTVHVPVISKEELKYSGLTGVIVISYFSNEMVYDGRATSVRMNFASHYTQDSLIDKIYTYYDRTPIINTVKIDLLSRKGDSSDKKK